MASLLLSWSSNVESLPANYVVPAEKRPGKPAPISKDVPVIDLADPDRAALVQKIITASQEFGLFQVINHGVPENLMINADKVAKEFFAMAAEEKLKLNAHKVEKESVAKDGWKLYTSYGNHAVQDFSYWKDTLEHWCHPLESCIKTWPDKPAQYREIIGPYSVEMRELGKRMLDLIYEGLGFTEEQFENYELFLLIHNYPACPDPSLALGTGGHHDTNLITILQQDVYGLQLFKDGQWLGVESLPNAFVINTGLALEVISNERLKSAMHPVITNSDCSRTSIVNFVNVPADRIIEPAKSVVSPSNPPLFRGYLSSEFFEVLLSKNSDTEGTFDYFRINSKAGE